MEVGQDKHVADFCCGWKNEMDKREPATEQAAPAAWTDSSQPASSPVLSSGPPPPCLYCSYQSAWETLPVYTGTQTLLLSRIFFPLRRQPSE